VAGEDAPRRRPLSSRTVLLATLGAAALFTTGVGALPHRGLTSVVYDLVLFNLVYLGAAVLSWRAARRVRQERITWAVAALTWLLSAVGNLLYPLTFEPGTVPSFPSPADLCWLATYPLIAVAALALVRARAPQLRPSSWLDAAIGALGVTACATSLVLLPTLHVSGLRASAATLAYPVSDVLLLALMGAVIAVDGVRQDRGLLLIGGAIACKLAGDVALSRGAALGGYEVGGPADLTYIVAGLLAALAAARAGRPGTRRRPDGGTRTGWADLALPLTCNVASLVVLAVQVRHGALDVGGVCAVGCVLASLLRTAVTFREVRALQEARRQAETDELTGLANRRALDAAAGPLLAAGRPVALLLIDLDGFKAVNDGLGHRAGDDLLRALAGRMRAAVRPDDVLARIGGDEFAVLLPDAGPEQADECARRLHLVLGEPVALAAGVAHVGASIGLAAAPADAATAPALLSAADAAMYAAKAARDGIRAWSAELAAARPEPGSRPSVREPGDDDLHLRLLLDGDGTAVAVEPATGPTALDDLPAVLADGAARGTSGRVPLEITLRPADLVAARPADRIAAALLRAGLTADALVVRLGPDAVRTGPEQAAALLHDLHTRGLRTAVCGSGAAVLPLPGMHRLPAERFHLDPQLVHDALTDPRAGAVVEHTAALARALGIVVVADLPADHPAAGLLARLGCRVRVAGPVVGGGPVVAGPVVDPAAGAPRPTTPAEPA
jgi:diguanylate cyclase (GGDEF)-like protein